MEEKMSSEKCAEDFKPNETRRIWKNIIVVSLAFMLQLTAYSGTANLQSSINAEAGLGTASLAALYAGVVFSNIFLPAMVIKRLGPKWAIFTCFLMFLPYIAAQLHATFYTLVPTALFLALAAGPLWCSKCTYLAEVAQVTSMITKIPADTLLTRYLGFFFMIYQTSQIWGNLISSLVLSTGNNTAAVTSLNETMIPLLCGANFLPSDSSSEGVLPTQPREKMEMMIGIFLGCIVCSALLVALGLDSLKRYTSSVKSGISEVKGLALLAVTLKQLGNIDQLLLLNINIFIGQHNAFFGADYTASFVSCAVGTGTVGYVMMTFGLSNAIGCFITNIIAKVYGRTLLITSALVIHGGVFVFMLIWRPHVGEEYIVFIIAALWGFCDSVWTVQINAYYGILFQGKKEAAFSNFRLWEAIGFIFSYSISAYVRTRYKIYLLIINMLVGVSGYLIVEWRQNSKIMTLND